VGQAPDERVIGDFADNVLKPARACEQNGFKIELARRVILRAVRQAATGEPQSQVDKRIH
jgi:xanthine dehydrogenase YagS FAD-binding subunit